MIWLIFDHPTCKSIAEEEVAQCIGQEKNKVFQNGTDICTNKVTISLLELPIAAKNFHGTPKNHNLDIFFQGVRKKKT